MIRPRRHWMMMRGWRKQVEAAAEILAAPALQGAEADDFVLLLVLREKWPVGSKARFKIWRTGLGPITPTGCLPAPCKKAQISQMKKA